MTRKGPPCNYLKERTLSATADKLWTNLTWMLVPKERHCQMAVNSVHSLSCLALTLYSISYFILDLKTECIGIGLESMYCSSLGNTEEIIILSDADAFSLKCFCSNLAFLCHRSMLPVRTQGDLSMLNYPNKIHRTLMPKMPLVHSTTFADVWNNLTQSLLFQFKVNMVWNNQTK